MADAALAANTAPLPPATRRAAAPLLLSTLALLLAAAVVWAVGHGAFRIAPADVLRLLLDLLPGVELAVDPQQAAVLTAIRLPRVVLALLTGAGLAVAGALMQGLFRNPLADPGLIGVAAGGVLAAATVIVLGAQLVPGALRAGSTASAFVLPLAAFGGSLVVTALVYAVGRAHGVLSLPVTLLAGIAINALAMALVGLLIFVASDEQLRTLTFWNLGSLSGGTWPMLTFAAPLVLLALAAAFALARPLNALALGEARAEHLGVDVAQVKRRVVVLTALATGALVGLTGVIGFIGLVAPHLVRLLCGPDHRVLLPASALLGALLVVAADVLARTVVSPAELPLGILTASMGAPFFLAMLLRRRGGLAL
jgi:iron complex transport system permease protein